MTTSDKVISIDDQVPHGRYDKPGLSSHATGEVTLKSPDERIATSPPPNLPLPGSHALTASSLAHFNACFCAAKKPEEVARLVGHLNVSPISARTGETPLLAAARLGDVALVRTLAERDARVDAYGQIIIHKAGKRATRVQRTPLQNAAEHGRLAVVKVLMEEFGADDSLVAPDGELALRLAAENGHREIVDYLPARRGGGWRRWKTKHDKRMRKAKSAVREIGTVSYNVLIAPPKPFVWDIPKVFVWDIPKVMWANRVLIWGGACEDDGENTEGAGEGAGQGAQVHVKWRQGAVRVYVEVGQGAARVYVKVGQGFAQVYVEVGQGAAGCGKSGAGGPALHFILTWIQTGVVRLGRALANGAKKMASLLHTAVAAALYFFMHITLRDVWDGLVVAMRAVFVDVPWAVAEFVVNVGELLGECLYLAIRVLWVAASYVPKRLSEIAEATGSAFRITFHEIIVHYFPKHISSTRLGWCM